jgi:DtxR family Mn-dependent transcriptional regulator
MLTVAEENYIKAIYKLAERNEVVTTKDIADRVSTKPSSVSDMLKKLADKKYINYEKYQHISLTKLGEKLALKTIRKHRLWEVFLVEKLGFGWEEIHPIAEELEHINSDELVNRLDDFLGNPQYDPHGDPIPTVEGKISAVKVKKLAETAKGETVVMTGVADHSAPFLKHLSKLNISLSTKLKVKDVNDFDRSMLVSIEGEKAQFISHEVAKSLLVTAS